MSEAQQTPEVEALWREVLVHGHRHDLAFLPFASLHRLSAGHGRGRRCRR